MTPLTHPDGREADACAEMVTSLTPRGPTATCLRAFCALLASGLLAGCTSIEGPAADVDQWKQSWRNRAGAVADGAGRSAVAVGDSLGTAYQGVRSGFKEPDPQGFGPYPQRYAADVKRHMLHFEGVSGQASFQFQRPVKGYTNKGILAGGEIEWQGYMVDVEIETKRLGGQKRSKSYVVRMRDHEVIEVLDATYADALRRFEQDLPASQAD